MQWDPQVSNASSNHAKILSQTVLFLRDSLEKMNAETSSAFNSSIHSTPSADEDIMTMSKVILESGMCGVEEGRKLFAPTVDPREKGLEKIENGWLSKFIRKDLVECLDEEVETLQCRIVILY